LPARLIITVKEKQPLFLIYKNINTTPIYALNTDGSYLGKQYFPLPEKYSKDVYKIVVSAKSELLNNNNINKYETLINIAEKTTGESLIYFDIRNPSDVYLIMSKCLIRLGEVDATVIERISRLKAIMPSVKPLENNLEYIDLRWDKALSLKEKIEEKNKIKEPNKKIEPVESIDTIKAVEQREANEALEKKEKLKQLENIQTTDKKDPIQQTSNESDP
ncbi:MAG: cell division protein FtsQ/DivIB, partial [Cyanobacteriota bacterium]